jgi:two-component system sensor histidine kinase/response regulator
MRKEDPIVSYQTAKILVVEDERDLAQMLSITLQKKGYETLEAYDGKEAWKKIQSENPDLLILDLMLPELDGWEICRMIRRDERKEIRETAILMLSARALATDRIYGLELGADDYLTKPFSLAELCLRVERILKKRRAVFELFQEVDHLRCKMQEQEMGLRRVIHDLKTPLLSMGASAKLLMRRANQDASLDFLRSIYENSLRLTHWLEEILLFSDSPSKVMAGEMEEVEIQTLVKKTVDLLRATGREKKIEIDFRPERALPAVLCNEKWMQRALENLLLNALKFTPEGGRVEVAVVRSAEEGGVEIIFKDNGIGIFAEDLPKIFEPFQRGRNAAGEKGIGLGLSLVKEVVDLHKGEVRVSSEPGKGSVFSIFIPLKTEPLPDRGIKMAC